MYTQRVHHRSKISTKFCTRQQILTQTSRIPNFIKIRPPVVELLHVDGQTEVAKLTDSVLQPVVMRAKNNKYSETRPKPKPKPKVQSKTEVSVLLGYCDEPLGDYNDLDSSSTAREKFPVKTVTRGRTR